MFLVEKVIEMKAKSIILPERDHNVTQHTILHL
jgi:hypothetical protein